MPVVGLSRPHVGLGRGRGLGVKHQKMHLERPRPLQRLASTDGAKNNSHTKKLMVHKEQEDGLSAKVVPNALAICEKLDRISNKSFKNVMIDHQETSKDILDMEKQFHEIRVDRIEERTSNFTNTPNDETVIKNVTRTNKSPNMKNRIVRPLPTAAGFEATDEDTNDLFHEILYNKSVDVNSDEHDDRTRPIWQYRGRSSSSLSSSAASSSGRVSAKSHLRMDDDPNDAQCKNQKRSVPNSSVFTVPPHYREVLGNPKVFGFIAMVSDTTITKVKGDKNKEAVLFLEIKGKTKNKLYAMKLLAERCEDDIVDSVYEDVFNNPAESSGDNEMTNLYRTTVGRGRGHLRSRSGSSLEPSAYVCDKDGSAQVGILSVSTLSVNYTKLVEQTSKLNEGVVHQNRSFQTEYKKNARSKSSGDYRDNLEWSRDFEQMKSTSIRNYMPVSPSPSRADESVDKNHNLSKVNSNERLCSNDVARHLALLNSKNSHQNGTLCDDDAEDRAGRSYIRMRSVTCDGVLLKPSDFTSVQKDSGESLSINNKQNVIEVERPQNEEDNNNNNIKIKMSPRKAEHVQKNWNEIINEADIQLNVSLDSDDLMFTLTLKGAEDTVNVVKDKIQDLLAYQLPEDMNDSDKTQKDKLKDNEQSPAVKSEPDLHESVITVGGTQLILKCSQEGLMLESADVLKHHFFGSAYPQKAKKVDRAVDTCWLCDPEEESPKVKKDTDVEKANRAASTQELYVDTQNSQLPAIAPMTRRNGKHAHLMPCVKEAQIDVPVEKAFDRFGIYRTDCCSNSFSPDSFSEASSDLEVVAVSNKMNAVVDDEETWTEEDDIGFISELETSLKNLSIDNSGLSPKDGAESSCSEGGGGSTPRACSSKSPVLSQDKQFDNLSKTSESMRNHRVTSTPAVFSYALNHLRSSDQKNNDDNDSIDKLDVSRISGRSFSSQTLASQSVDDLNIAYISASGDKPDDGIGRRRRHHTEEGHGDLENEVGVSVNWSRSAPGSRSNTPPLLCREAEPKGNYGRLGYRMPSNVRRDPLGPLSHADEVRMAEQCMSRAPLTAVSRRILFRSTMNRFHRMEVEDSRLEEKVQTLGKKRLIRYSVEELLSYCSLIGSRRPPHDFDLMKKSVPCICRNPVDFYDESKHRKPFYVVPGSFLRPSSLKVATSTNPDNASCRTTSTGQDFNLAR